MGCHVDLWYDKIDLAPDTDTATLVQRRNMPRSNQRLIKQVSFISSPEINFLAVNEPGRQLRQLYGDGTFVRLLVS